MSRYRHLSDGTAFPIDVGELEWKLRYHPETLEKSDYLVLADVVASYEYLIKETTQKRRNFICKELRDDT